MAKMTKFTMNFQWMTMILLATLALSACQSTNAQNENQRKMSLTEEKRVKRFLAPLPQELRLSGDAIEVAAGDVALLDAVDASEMEKTMIADFKEKWRKKRGHALKTENSRLTIIAGVLKNSPKLREAAEKGLFSSKYLSERPNSEEAYALTTVTENDDFKVYLAAKAPQGLFYGLETLDNLFNGLSEDKKLVLPECAIVDWPDIRWRGTWRWTTGDLINHYHEVIREFAGLRFNFADYPPLRPKKLDENGQLVVMWGMPKDCIAYGERHAVKVFPGSSHITLHQKQKVMKEHFADIKGTPEAGTKAAKNHSVCHAKPKTKDFLRQYMVSIARQFDFAGISMSELEGASGVCHCDKCAGDPKKAFLAEIKSIIASYEAAKKINPKFRIMIGLTQGTYPFNLELLNHVPKDVLISFYHGGMTYLNKFQRYNLPPSANEMLRRGFMVGVTPSPVPWNSNLTGPFDTPQYIRMLCGEAEDRGLVFMKSFLWPEPLFNEINCSALSEFLWNSDGRSAKEFCAAWATRKGLKNPDETAAVIDMLEYPERAIRNCDLERTFHRIIKFVIGRDRANTSSLRGFEFRKHEEMARALEICREAVGRTKKLENPELFAAAELSTCWMVILERYAFCAENAKDQGKNAAAMKTLRNELDKLPKLFIKWQATRKNISDRERKVLLKSFDKSIGSLVPEIHRELSENAKTLLKEKEACKVTVMELDPKWRFQTAANDIGLKGKWASTTYKDAKWPEILAGQGHGWEKQGYEGYTGYAWYRQKLKLPKNMKEKKHLYLLFKGVDEDGEIFINGQKAFTHDYKTVGCQPAKTWDKPFSFNAKPFLKPGTENTIAIRVFNRYGMGGIWQPAFLIATDLEANTEDLSAVTVNP